MAQVIPNTAEKIESVLRRFKREVSKSGIFQDIKKNRYFETPNEKLKRKERNKHRQNKKRKRYR